MRAIIKDPVGGLSVRIHGLSDKITHSIRTNEINVLDLSEIKSHSGNEIDLFLKDGTSFTINRMEYTEIIII